MLAWSWLASWLERSDEAVVTHRAELFPAAWRNGAAFRSPVPRANYVNGPANTGGDSVGVICVRPSELQDVS